MMKMAKRVNEGVKFSAALAAVLFAVSLSGAAQTGRSSSHRHFSQHHSGAASSESKKLPRSTVNVGLPVVKLASTNAAEVQRLEREAVSQIHTEGRGGARTGTGSGAPRFGEGRGHEHSAAINFSYHAAQNGSRTSTSGARRR